MLKQIGYVVEILVDSGANTFKINGVVDRVENGFVAIVSDNDTVYVAIDKIVSFKRIKATRMARIHDAPMWIYACSHPLLEGQIHFFSPKENASMEDIPYSGMMLLMKIPSFDKEQLSIARIGNFYDLTRDLQIAFCKNMSSMNVKKSL